MEIVKSQKLKDVFTIVPKIFGDNRGWFYECFSFKDLEPYIPSDVSFVQHNRSFSAQVGTLRGMHFQRPPFTQAKLVEVEQGSIMDVIVDLRPDSPTYLQWQSFELSTENRTMLYVPRGFAHGFVTTSNNVIFHYLCDNYYDKSSDGGFVWNDPELKIDWSIKDPILSDKDKTLPCLSEIKSSLVW